MLKLRKNKKGFSLVELIVVIAIMAVLAAVVGGTVSSQLNKQKDSLTNTEVKEIVGSIRTILEADTENTIIGDDNVIDNAALLDELKGEYPNVTFGEEAAKSGNQKYKIVYNAGNTEVSVLYICVHGDNKGKTKGYTYNAENKKITAYTETAAA